MTIHNTSREALSDIADAFAHFLRTNPPSAGLSFVGVEG